MKESEGSDVVGSVEVVWSVEGAESVVVPESVEVVPSADIPVVSELAEDVSPVSVELEIVPVIASTTENGSPSASAPDAITPRRSRPTTPAATFAHHSLRDLLVRSEPLPTAT